MTSAWARTAWALLGTVALHGALLLGLFLGTPPASRPTVRPPVKIRVVSRPRPTPKPPEPAEPAALAAPAPAPVAPPAPRPKPAPRPAPPAVATPALAPVEPPPAPAAPAAEAPRPVRRFSVAMEATLQTGGVAVPAAPASEAWSRGARDGAIDGERRLGPAPAPGAERGTGPAGPERPYTAAEVSRPPRLVSQPTSAEMRSLYPATARRDGLEADVSLRVLVGTAGEVVEVKLVRGAGQGFDEVALALVRRFRFEAGSRDGRPVPVWIPWTYKFRLDG